MIQLSRSRKKDTATKTQASETYASKNLPTYEEIPKSSKKTLMDKLEEKIKDAQKPEDLLIHLLSTELSITEKAALLEHAPSHIYDYDRHYKNAEKVEAQLKDTGHGELSIVLYWPFFWYREQPDGSGSWIKKLIEIDIEKHWIAQRNACIQQKIQILQISSERPLSSGDEAEHAWQFNIYK